MNKDQVVALTKEVKEYELEINEGQSENKEELQNLGQVAQTTSREKSRGI